MNINLSKSDGELVRALSQQKGFSLTATLHLIILEYCDKHKVGPTPDRRASYELRAAIINMRSARTLQTTPAELAACTAAYNRLRDAEGFTWASVDEAIAWLDAHPRTKEELKLWAPRIAAVKAASQVKMSPIMQQLMRAHEAGDEAALDQLTKEAVTPVTPNPTEDDWGR